MFRYILTIIYNFLIFVFLLVNIRKKRKILVGACSNSLRKKFETADPSFQVSLLCHQNQLKLAEPTVFV